MTCDPMTQWPSCHSLIIYIGDWLQWCEMSTVVFAVRRFMQLRDPYKGLRTVKYIQWWHKVYSCNHWNTCFHVLYRMALSRTHRPFVIILMFIIAFGLFVFVILLMFCILYVNCCVFYRSCYVNCSNSPWPRRHHKFVIKQLPLWRCLWMPTS